MTTSKVARRPRIAPAPGSRFLISAAVATALAAALPSARAQDAPAANQPKLEEVTVTGSRILRRDLESSSPLVTVGSENFENTSTVGVESTLNKMPQFIPSETQFVTGDVQASAFDTPGISAVNLRGLGDNRNLVLIDGRRAQPSNATLVVDVNSIPAAAIANVEVITGGASATYGADAIAGVVNFKLKDNFQGLSLDAQTGISQKGDGEESRASALVGSNFGNGGNVMVGVEWSKRQAVQQADRDFYVKGFNDPGTGSPLLNSFSSYTPVSNFPSKAAVSALYPGITGVGNNTAFFFNTDGTLFKNTAVIGNPAASSAGFNSPSAGIKTLPSGALDQPERDGWASSPMTRYSLFGRGKYRFNDNISAFAQANFTSTDVQSSLAYAPATSFWAATIPRDAAHPVPPELATLLDSRAKPNDPWTLERVLDFMGPRGSDDKSTVYQVMVGLDGNLGIKDWTWEAYGSHGETHVLNYLNSGFVSVDRYRDVVQAPNYGAGFKATDATGGILGYQLSCTSGLPIFSSFPVSQDCINAITAKMKNITDLYQDIVEVNTQGAVVDLPAGQVRGALGLSYRKDAVAFDPDILNTQASIVDNPIGLFAANGTAGHTSVKEAYGELLVPVIKDKPLLKQLNLELGGRWSDYNTAGSAWTYKGLANWTVNNFINFRGGYNYASRAPNTAELFLGTTQAVVLFPFSDPCAVTTLAPWGNVASNPKRAQVQALCAGLIKSGTSIYDQNPNTYVGGNGGYFPLEIETRQGNTSLKPERAHTWTFGTVLKSPFASDALSNLTASIDWYKIVVNDAISPLPSLTVYQNCFNVDGKSNPTYSVNDPGGFCKLIQRDPVTGGRVAVSAPYYNLGAIRTDGLDLSINWRARFSDMGLERLPGGLSLSLAGSYLFSYKTQNQPGGVYYENADTGNYYKWRTYTTLSYFTGVFNVGLNWQHLPTVRNAAAATTPTTKILPAASYDNFGLFGGWNITEALAMRFGIDNLFDRQPVIVGAQPGVTNSEGTTNPGFYDVLGRRFYIGLKLNL